MPGLIPQDFIDELITRTDIVEVVGGRVPLKKAGREFKACCPFHDEKTASFTVSPDKQFYHCFGCGAHGTALSFLMDYDHMGFVEAVEDLASRVGLDIPREADADSGSERRSGDELYDLMQKVHLLYRRCLKSAPSAVEYLKARGLTGETAREFGVGYVPEAWDTVLGEFGGNSASVSNLETLGLIISRENTSGHYDRFRGRVMFPIRDGRGRVIGFGGRIIGDGEPKYLNSPETPLFHKGRELYGLYEAKRALKSISRLLVVEGYMDVVGLAQHRVRYAVATLGTATTDDHLKKLFRVADEIVFSFDGDRAGRAAAWRALETTLPHVREGRQVRFLFLPEGEDPDSLIRKEGAERFEARLKESMPLSEYLIARLSEEVDQGSLDGRARLGELARPYMQKIPRGTFWSLLVGKLAHSVGLPADDMEKVILGAPPPSTRGQPGQPQRIPRRQVSSGRPSLVQQAVSLVLLFPHAAAEIEIPADLREMELPGISLLVELLEETATDPNLKTGVLVERWRDRQEWPHLMRLAAVETFVTEDTARDELAGALQRLVQESLEMRAAALLARAEQLTDEEKQELQALLTARTVTDDELGIG